MAFLFSESQLNWEYMGIIKGQLYKEDTNKRSLLTERVTKLWEKNRPKYYWQHDRWNAYEANKMHRGRWTMNQLLIAIMF